MTNFLEREIENIPVIDSRKRYWFIRTYSGETFSHYFEGNYVGLGINHIPLNLVKEARVSVRNTKALADDEDFELTVEEDVMEDRSAFLRLANYIDEHTSYHKGVATRTAKQLVDFENNMSVGDTIVIPSKHSNQFAIGTITSEPYTASRVGTFDFKNFVHEYPARRRRVQWDKIIDKANLQGDFKAISNSQNGITNVDQCKDIIDGTIRSLYIRDEHAYLTLKINQDQDINAFVLNRFLGSVTYFYQEFCRENNLPVDEDLTIKIRLQSRGKMGMIGAVVVGIAGVSGMLNIANRHDVKMELGTYRSVNASDGTLDFYNQFIHHTQERQAKAIEFNQSIQELRAMNFTQSLPGTENNPLEQTEIIGE